MMPFGFVRYGERRARNILRVVEAAVDAVSTAVEESTVIGAVFRVVKNYPEVYKELMAELDRVLPPAPVLSTA